MAVTADSTAHSADTTAFTADYVTGEQAVVAPPGGAAGAPSPWLRHRRRHRGRSVADPVRAQYRLSVGGDSVGVTGAAVEMHHDRSTGLALRILTM